MYVLYEMGTNLVAIEIKSGATIASDYFSNLTQVADLIPNINKKAVVYGGAEIQQRCKGEIVAVAQMEVYLG